MCPADLSLGLEQGLPNVVYVEKSVCCCCYMHAENDDSTCGSETFQSHGDGHCMNWIGNGLCVCPDIVDHEKAADDISNCLDSHMVHASCFHGYHDNSFHQNPLCNAIREGRMDLLSYGCPAPYVNNSDEKTEVGD